VVVSTLGDTVLNADDLYSDYTDGINLSPLLLTSDITVAAPIKSNGEYILNVRIWDKKGDGHFSARLNFKVKPNDQLLIEPSNVTYNEIYLYSEERECVITDNKIRFNEHSYIIFEGLNGFKEKDGLVYPGLSLKGTDNTGAVILDYEDMFAEYGEKGLNVIDFNTHVSSNFILTGTEFKNPLHCVWTIWDKNSSSRLITSTDLNIY